MAGKRMIHANICESRKLSTISLAAETLYYRLLTRVDDDGNFTAEARIVLGQCAPMRKDWNETMITGLLEELAVFYDRAAPVGVCAYQCRHGYISHALEPELVWRARHGDAQAGARG